MQHVRLVLYYGLSKTVMVLDLNGYPGAWNVPVGSLQTLQMLATHKQPKEVGMTSWYR